MSVSALAVQTQHLGVLSMPKEAILVPVEASQSQIVWSSDAVTPLLPSGEMHSTRVEVVSTAGPRSTEGLSNSYPLRKSCPLIAANLVGVPSRPSATALSETY